MWGMLLKVTHFQMFHIGKHCCWCFPQQNSQELHKYDQHPLIKRIAGQILEPLATMKTEWSVHLVQILLYYPDKMSSPMNAIVWKN